MALVFFHTRFRGREYEVDVQDLTNKRLIQMKEWFGKEYGAFDGLPRLMSERDSAAWACALWIGAQKHGYPEFRPRDMDFHFDEFEFLEIEEPEADEADDPKADETDPDQTQDSPSIASSDSGPSTSTSSSKPGRSAPKK